MAGQRLSSAVYQCYSAIDKLTVLCYSAIFANTVQLPLTALPLLFTLDMNHHLHLPNKFFEIGICLCSTTSPHNTVQQVRHENFILVRLLEMAERGVE